LAILLTRKVQFLNLHARKKQELGKHQAACCLLITQATIGN